MKPSRLFGYFLICIGLLTPLLAGGIAAENPTAREQLGSLRRSLREARDKGEWDNYRARAIEIGALLNGSPNALLEVAKADLKLGRVVEARAEVQHVLDMGQADESLAAAPFDVLHDLAESLTANRRPVSRGRAVWEIEDSGLLPEDIDVDPTTHRFFLTSVLEKKIVWLDAAGKARNFATAPDAWPMLGLKVDAKRRRLWATEVALENFSIVPKAEWGRSALLCYELDKGNLLFRIEGPEHSALGDMVLMPDGTPVLSDGAGGGIYRLRNNKTLERLDGGEFISPQTPAIDAEGQYLFVPDYLRGIGVLNLSTRQVRWLAMGSKFALNGIDGLYRTHDKFLAVQNGTSPERVVEFDLDAGGEKVVSQNVIEASTATLGDPTHGVVVGSDFYYIANSGWDTLDDHGEHVSGAKASTARIMQATITK
jgi:hypothetical protein